MSVYVCACVFRDLPVASDTIVVDLENDSLVASDTVVANLEDSPVASYTASSRTSRTHPWPRTPSSWTSRTYRKRGTGKAVAWHGRKTSWPWGASTISPPSYFLPGALGAMLLVGSASCRVMGAGRAPGQCAATIQRTWPECRGRGDRGEGVVDPDLEGKGDGVGRHLAPLDSSP